MDKNFPLSFYCVIALSFTTTALASPDKSAAPSVVPSHTATAPAAEKAAQPTASPLAGKVLETMDSGGYTYLYLEKKNGEKVWVAALATPVKVGSQVSFKGGNEMLNFESKSLKRTFDKIIFAEGAMTDNSAKDATTYKGKSTTGGSKAAAAGKDGKISVSKATGVNAYTVEEIFSNSTKLNKKKVVVKGKVVKVSARIMGLNWIHIQDGTGNQAKKNHNLVCTSKEIADVDDVVTISGILAKDKDFGGGYKYTAIVEESTIKK